MDKTELFEVDDDVLEKVVKLFDKNIKSLDEDVSQVKEWIKTQPHLPEIMDEKMIQNFLIQNKFSIERTKPKIDMYYTIRTFFDDVVKDRNPKHSNMKRVNEGMYIVPLPKLTKEMYRVFWFKVNDKNVLENLEPYNVCVNLINIFEIRMTEDVAFGDIYVWDVKDFPFKYLIKFTPTVIYNLIVVVYEKVFSSRLKAFYIINAFSIVEKLLAIAKTIMKPKLFARIHVLKDPEAIKQYLDKEVLPADYGGEEKSIEQLQGLVNSKFLEYENRFDELDQLRVNETLRPQKLKNSEEFGYFGNFKKLDVD